MSQTPARSFIIFSMLLFGFVADSSHAKPLQPVLDEPAVLGGPALLRFQEFRNLDGSGNNTANPEWGSAFTPLLRHLAAPAYEDNIQAPPSTGLPEPRSVSNSVVASPGPRANTRGASNFIWQWGQFIDHDVARTFPGQPDEPMPIAVPQWDPWFDPTGTGTQTITFSRSRHTMVSGVRQQVNEITAFIDGSQVYGSDVARANELRLLNGKGMLKTSRGGYLPYNDNAFANEPAANDASFFLAGDTRVNEQLGLTAMHTLFLREHNHQAKLLRQRHPHWDGDRIFGTARALVGAEIQVITYKEFLPMLLGPNGLAPYSGYKPAVNPGIDNAFSAAAYRLGHTLLTSELLRLKHNGKPIARGNVALRDAFFVPDEFVKGQGMEPLLRGLAMNQAQEVDPFIVDDVRNFLFGPPGSGGFDLASLNIQRGRDHGLPRYNAMRVQLGLAAKTSFNDVCADPLVQSRLARVYSDVDDIDLWVGGLCEDHMPGAMLGELLYTILSDQFTRLRDGDRFYYANYFNDSMVQELEQTTLAQIIRRNTSIGNEISDHVFEMTPVVVAASNLDARGEAPDGEYTENGSEAFLAATVPVAPVVVGEVFPNPARSYADVQVSLEGSSAGLSSGSSHNARIVVYDVRGRQVRTLHDGALRTGANRWRWDLQDATGRRVPNGLYFLRVETDGIRSTRKVLLVN